MVTAHLKQYTSINLNTYAQANSFDEDFLGLGGDWKNTNQLNFTK